MTRVLIVPFLLMSCMAMSAAGKTEPTEIFVRINGDMHNLAGTSSQLGEELETLLNAVPNGSCCFVWSADPSSTVEISQTIVLSADETAYVFRNVSFVAAAHLNYLVRVTGSQSTIVGLSVDADGDSSIYDPPCPDPDQPSGIKRGVGIQVGGDNISMIDCESVQMPNGPVASCYEIGGQDSFLSCCKARNPGSVGFRVTAKFAHLDRVESFIDRATENGKNRLVGVSGQTQMDHASEFDGHVQLTNSLFHAEFTEDTPATHRNVNNVFDPGDDLNAGLARLDIINCKIVLGESVNNSAAGPAFKVVDILECNIDGLTVKTHKDFGSYAAGFHRTVDHGGDVEITITDSDLDQGINFQGNENKPIGKFSVVNSRIGRPYSDKGNELITNADAVTTLEATNSVFESSKSIFAFSQIRSDTSMHFQNCSFVSRAAKQDGTPIDSFVFRTSNVPLRSDFWNGDAVTFERTEDAGGGFFLSNNPLRRLALSGQPDVQNSYMLDTRYGTTNSESSPVSSNIVYSDFDNHIPMKHLPGEEGDRIYLHPDAQADNEKPPGWSNAQYWEYRGGRWEPISE